MRVTCGTSSTRSTATAHVRSRSRGEPAASTPRRTSPRSASSGCPSGDFRSTPSTLTRFDGRCGRRGGVVAAQGTTYVDDLTVRDGQLLTSPTRTALDIASSHDVEQRCGRGGQRPARRRTTREALARRAAAMDQWPDSLLVRRVLRLADARPESWQSTARLLVRAVGLPDPVPQMPVSATGDLPTRLAWPELKVWVEVDGRASTVAGCVRGRARATPSFAEAPRGRDPRATGWICIR